jgi:co-chaperonin GroES (HSP10)
MRIRVSDDRCYVVLTPMVKTKTITNKFGEEIEFELPENHHERSRIGEIKQVGEKVHRYKVGDKVLLSVYAGTRIHLIDKEIDGEPIDEDRHRIIREEEILCVVED